MFFFPSFRPLLTHGTYTLYPIPDTLYIRVLTCIFTFIFPPAVTIPGSNAREIERKKNVVNIGWECDCDCDLLWDGTT